MSRTNLRSEELLETKGMRGMENTKAIPPMVEMPRATMAHNQERQEQPPNPPIDDPLVRPKGLPILVPRNSTMLEMPSQVLWLE